MKPEGVTVWYTHYSLDWPERIGVALIVLVGVLVVRAVLKKLRRNRQAVP